MKRYVIFLILAIVLGGCLDNESQPIPEESETPEESEIPGEEDEQLPEESETPEVSQIPEVSEVIIHEEPVYDVIIVGAGISGLSAAFSLQDYTIKVLEKNDKVGGRILSGSYKGVAYAKGAEYIGKPEGLLRKMISQLKLQLREIPSPMDAQFYKGKFYYGEDAIASLFINYSSLEEYNDFALTILGYYHKYEWLPDFRADSELAYLDFMTAREWFSHMGFPEIFADRYNVAARGLFGANIDEISALSFIPEIAFDYEGFEPIIDTDLEDSLVKGEESTEAYSFENGLSELTDALAAYLGDKIQVNSTVTQVLQNNERYTVYYEDEKGNTHAMTSKVVILAVPAPISLKLAPDILDKEQKEILEQIPYASYATVALFSEVPIFDRAFDLAVPDDYFFTDVYDAVWISEYYDSPGNVTPYIITVYVAPHSYKDRSLLSMSDEEILENIYTDLEKIFPQVRQKITGYDITRFPYAYPVMVTGAHHRLSRLHVITHGSFLLAGDYTIYPTLEAAVESGEIAAEKAREQLSNDDNLSLMSFTILIIIILISNISNHYWIGIVREALT
ncbi:MAG: FAD-dependent oxidoreductase [Theionarchaea archaeon]|nr:FAD-dependent oxidoreductase [Theionarchaea archaeon]